MLLWLLLAVALGIFIAISFIEDEESELMALKKAGFRETLTKIAESEEILPDSLTVLALNDSLVSGDSVSNHGGVSPVILEPDTTVKQIFIFGDSMTILIAARLAAYGRQNGYKVSSLTWDSSSTVIWSNSDTIEKYMKEINPDFVMITLGSNELFLQHFESRKPNVKKIIDKLAGIPFIWIGPPNWKEDKGFNDMMESVLPRGTYFRTEGMELDRGPDHVHPTRRAGALWADSVMRWIVKSPHPIRAEIPDSSIGSPRFDSHYIKAH